jgi:NADH dehydrogenase
MTSARRVTVFGGSGFIGRYVVQRLAQLGAVIAVVGPRASRARTLLTMGDVGQIALINGALSQERLVRESLAGADTVINLVGILSEHGRQTFEAVQHQGAATVARLAAEAGVKKFVQMSALGADPHSRSRYARSKAAGEAAVLQHFPHATIFRPSVVFGPEDDFFNRFAKLAQLSPFLPLIGGGKSRFQPVYVGDVADAIVIAVQSSATEGRVFELGGPTIFSFRELMELLLMELDANETDGVLKRHAMLGIPFPVASVMALASDMVWSLPFARQLLGPPPLTRDQLLLLRGDNIVDPSHAGFAELGIVPTAPELILPTYLARYRRGGWYTTRKMA